MMILLIKSLVASI
jgi:hypothetical protein